MGSFGKTQQLRVRAYRAGSHFDPAFERVLGLSAWAVSVIDVFYDNSRYA